MKELSIEQKAKLYDEAKLRISAAYNSNRCTIGFMNEIFPELKESGGEDGVSGPVHPNAKLVAAPLKEEFIKRGLL